LTGRENIYVNASVLGLSKREIDAKLNEIVDFAEIADFIDMPVQNYSSGMQVRLGFAVAVNTAPSVLLLDEVLAVGDVAFQAKCFNTLADFRAQGTAFILVSHSTHIIQRYANRVLYLTHGEVAHCGDPDSAIEAFLTDMRQRNSGTENDRTEWTRVYGSGKLAFTAARFRTTDGEEVSTINAGDGLTLEIDYERKEELDEAPVLDVVIRDREGIVFQGTSATSEKPLNQLPPRGCFQVRFPEMPVNTHYVDFSFAALHRTTSEVFDWKRNVRLNIRSRPGQAGRVALAAEWRYLSEREA
jgi:ABC-2 type transport system ATP-binding protein